MIYQKGAVGHIFQRARSGFVVFYSVKDSLVFFTIFSLTAAKHRIRVLGLCLMYNHIHVLVEAEDHKTIARFMQELCSKFSKTYNIRHGLKGSLLSTYGLSNKRGGKQARTHSPTSTTTRLRTVSASGRKTGVGISWSMRNLTIHIQTSSSLVKHL